MVQRDGLHHNRLRSSPPFLPAHHGSILAGPTRYAARSPPRGRSRAQSTGPGGTRSGAATTQPIPITTATARAASRSANGGAIRSMRSLRTWGRAPGRGYSLDRHPDPHGGLPSPATAAGRPNQSNSRKARRVTASVLPFRARTPGPPSPRAEPGGDRGCRMFPRRSGTRSCWTSSNAAHPELDYVDDPSRGWSAK